MVVGAHHVKEEQATYGYEGPRQKEERDQGDNPHGHCFCLCFIGDVAHVASHELHVLSGSPGLFRYTLIRSDSLEFEMTMKLEMSGSQLLSLKCCSTLFAVLGWEGAD